MIKKNDITNFDETSIDKISFRPIHSQELLRMKKAMKYI